MFVYYFQSSIDLPILVYKYMGAKLDYKNGDFNVTGFGCKIYLILYSLQILFFKQNV